MNGYSYNEEKDKWEAELIATKDRDDRIARRIYSTKDYYYCCWKMARHGLLVLDYRGLIMDINPYFCEKIGYSKEELLGKNINDFCVRAEDLHASDSINILTLLQSINQQTTNQCELRNKETRLFRVRWVANRIPASLASPFSHSLVCVYFLGESSYNQIVDEFNKLKKKESNILWKILDSLWAKATILIIVILSALSGNLPDLINKVISLFGGTGP